MSKVSCQGCGAVYRVDVQHAGRTLKCKKCGKGIGVPEDLMAAGEVENDDAFDPFQDALNSSLANRDQSQIEPPAGASVKPVKSRKSVSQRIAAVNGTGDSRKVNPYRLLRIIMGTAICIGGFMMIYLVRTVEPGPNTSAGQVWWNRILHIGIGLFLLGLGGPIALTKASEAERNARLFGTLGKPAKWGFPALAVALLLMILLQGDSIQVQVLGLGTIVVSGWVIVRAFQKHNKSLEPNKFHPAATDLFAIAVIPLFVAVPFWVVRVKNVLDPPRVMSKNPDQRIALIPEGVTGLVTIGTDSTKLVDGYARWMESSDGQRVLIMLVSRALTATEKSTANLETKSNDKSLIITVTFKKAATEKKGLVFEDLETLALNSRTIQPGKRFNFSKTRVDQSRKEMGVEQIKLDLRDNQIGLNVSINENAATQEATHVQFKLNLPVSGEPPAN